jgi:CRISPR-associated protein Cas1
MSKAVLHVTTQGARVHVRGNLLETVADGVCIGRSAVPLTATVVLHGGVGITTPALSRLLSEGIDVAFLAADGRFKGRLESIGSSAATLRFAQVRAALDPAVHRALASVIAGYKVVSQWRVLRALRIPWPRDPAWFFQRLSETTSPEEVRGVEGFASRAYFGALRSSLGSSYSGWTRQHHPPPDGLNALLSYGYAILQSRVLAACGIVGFDPYVGFLHETGRPRPALALDLMEEFRAPVVDFTVVRLVRELGPWGWWTASGKDGARLSAGARDLLIQRIEARLASSTMHRPSRQRAALVRVIELQARGLAAAVSGRPRRFKPYAGVPWDVRHRL